MLKYDLIFILVACLELYLVTKIDVNNIDKNFFNNDIPLI